MTDITINLNRFLPFNSLKSQFELIDWDNENDFVFRILHRKDRWIQVEFYPIFCSIYNELISLEKNVTIYFELPENCDQLTYAERMNFLRHLNIEYTSTNSRRPSAGRFIELRKLLPNSYGITGLNDVFRNDFEMNEEASNDLDLIINELICNCSMHSKARSGSFFYCQKYPSKRLLELYIVDSGIGIPNSMLSNSKYANNTKLEVLNLSLEWEEGSGNGRGHGLYLVSEFIKRNNFNFILHSDSFEISILNGRKIISESSFFKGVFIKLSIGYEVKVTMSQIMKERGYT